MKKLIAIDIDGTLLDSRLRLQKETEDVLRSLISEGHDVVLATGRPYRSLQVFYDRLGCKSPAIIFNGAGVINPSDPSFKSLALTFPKEEIKSILRDVDGKCLLCVAESFETMYSTAYDAYLDDFFPYRGINVVYGNVADNMKEDVITTVFKCNDEDVPLFKEKVESYEGFGYRHWTGAPYSEIYLKGVNKGSALSYVIKSLGYKKEDVIAFGDSLNDMEMLLDAGMPFAMKGCKAEALRERFPETDGTNDENGVARTLKRILG
jgi:Cof subfamily protein (haloacid dehalogenase superfamily)